MSPSSSSPSHPSADEGRAGPSKTASASSASTSTAGIAAHTSTSSPASGVASAQGGVPTIAAPIEPSPVTSPAPGLASPPGTLRARSPRPQNVVMPSPPYMRAQSGSGAGASQRAGAASGGHAASQSISGLVTPTEPAASSPRLSPTSMSGGGPLSPSASYGAGGGNSFIFPIRSVFQGMNTSESSGSVGGSGLAAAAAAAEGQGGLQRVNSRSQQHQQQRAQQSPASPALGAERRFSQSFAEADEDGGMATIAQMLGGDGGFHQMAPQIERKPSGQPSVATFSGRIDRQGTSPTQGSAASESGSTPEQTSRASPAGRGSAGGQGASASQALTSEMGHGFFSAPLPDKGSDQSAFFTEMRRASDEGPAGSSLGGAEGGAEERPPLKDDSSRETIKAARGDAVEQRGEESGGGFSRRDDGRTIAQPTSENEAGPSRPGANRQSGAGASIDKPGRIGMTRGFVTNTRKTDKGLEVLVEPASKRSAADERERDTSRSVVSQRSGASGAQSQPVLEVGEDGVHNLVADFSGIVRLGDVGSHSGGGTRIDTGTGTGTGAGTGEGSGTGNESGSKSRSKRSNDPSDKPSGRNGAPTHARLAQQNRLQTRTTGASRDAVRDFIDDQAHTVNMSDPNAPTPKPPSQSADSSADSLAQLDALGTGEGLGFRTPREQAEGGGEYDETDSSLSVRDSSEMATASGEDRSGDLTDDDEEPIVTFRFEHFATEDGHHLVMGREGNLQRCEDEPITTPGAVQGFGVLIVLEEDYDTGILLVRQVSENATELLGLSPKYLFQLDCFSRILTRDQEDLLRDNIDYLPDNMTGGTALEDEGPQVFLLSGYGEPGSQQDDEDENTESSSTSVAGRRKEWTAWCAAHRPKQPTWDRVDESGKPLDPPDLIILEFELERDVYNPLMQTFEPTQLSSGRLTPDSGSQTTLSAGSGGNQSRTATSGSGTASAESETTIGSTARPSLRAAGSDDTSASATVTMPSSHAVSSMGSRPSSKLPSGMEPMGLEGIEVEMPLERIIESTTNHAKPLRALERMRRTGGTDDSASGSGSGSRSRGGRARRPLRRAQPGTTGTMDVFAILGQINDQLGSAPDLDTFLKIVVGVVQDVCRFHRVLLYQFDEAYNGQVVAELVEWGKTTDLYKGLMFPAADIPAQARELYKINKVRLLYDRSQTTARMVLRSKEDLDHPLDMTHCFLRAMSPIHIKYLANMHVRSSMSVSIMAFGQLWGLIACHSYGHHGMRVSFPVRQMMRILSDSISRNIERLSYAERLHTRKLISTIPSQQHPTGYIVSNADDLLQIFDADAGLLVIGDGCKLLGQSEQGQAMLAIAEYFRILKFDSTKATNHISRDFPDLVIPHATDMISGLMYVPLTAKAGQDFIVFLRKGQAREVKWAGKPYKTEASGEAASLEPRKSFKTWSEIVTGRSRAWTDDQCESAGVLALIYGKFIQVWREKQSAMASNQLTAILLSNTSHAVRTPLSQIINTLELALAGDIDSDTRSMLENSHQASRALLFHVHDLLDLTRIETGNETAFNDPFDLRQIIQDAVRLYQTECARRNIDFRVNLDPNLPQFVIGDSRKIKTVISNLVANSVKYTEKGWIEVYCGLQQETPGRRGDRAVGKPGYVPLEFVIADTGIGIPTEKLQAMFVTLEGADELQSSTPATGLGLGLAVVARIVEQLAGQLRAESESGVGSRFFFTLQMLEHDGRELSRTNSMNSSIVPRARTGSSEGSVQSQRSSAKSEIDSFVQDFGGSHMLAAASADDARLRDAETRMNRPGTFPVTDSSYPVRPSRVDTESEGTHSSGSPGATPSAPAIGPAAGAAGTGRPALTRRATGQSADPPAGAGSVTLPTSPGGRAVQKLPGSPRAEQRNASSFASRHAQTYGSPAHSRGHSGLSVNSSSESPTFSSLPAPESTSAEARAHAHVHAPAMNKDGVPMRSHRGPNGKQQLRVMVVEDDVINSQILQKRLKMDKHSVVVASNGQEAVDALRRDWDIDAVLMDIQMPIMDGRLAAQTIRELEQKMGGTPDDISPLRVDGRVPIFAVSASLYESDRHSLMQNFDGWLLKPLDFKRVRDLFAGLEDPYKRNQEVYFPGQWERGGYFQDSPDAPRTPGDWAGGSRRT